MIDALLDFVTMIKDYLMSLLDGLWSLVESLAFISDTASEASVWMPSFMFGILVLDVALIIVLRVIGR